MNQSSIDRGLFRSSFFRTYNGTCTKKQGSYNPALAETFEVPVRSTCSGLRHGSYEKLDFDGLAEPGARVSCDDILIGKTVPYPVSNPDGSLSQIARKDASIGMRSTENGIVDTVMLTTTQDGEVIHFTPLSPPLLHFTFPIPTVILLTVIFHSLFFLSVLSSFTSFSVPCFNDLPLFQLSVKRTAWLLLWHNSPSVHLFVRLFSVRLSVCLVL
jgi:DNA-directed RNA polymerase beta subunit